MLEFHFLDLRNLYVQQILYNQILGWVFLSLLTGICNKTNDLKYAADPVFSTLYHKILNLNNSRKMQCKHYQSQGQKNSDFLLVHLPFSPPTVRQSRMFNLTSPSCYWEGRADSLEPESDKMLLLSISLVPKEKVVASFTLEACGFLAPMNLIFGIY